jgi:hypothetical protein
VLDPLTVTGTKVPTPQSQVPAVIDVITQEDLERQQPMTDRRCAAETAGRRSGRRTEGLAGASPTSAASAAPAGAPTAW